MNWLQQISEINYRTGNSNKKKIVITLASRQDSKATSYLPVMFINKRYKERTHLQAINTSGEWNKCHDF